MDEEKSTQQQEESIAENGNCFSKSIHDVDSKADSLLCLQKRERVPCYASCNNAAIRSINSLYRFAVSAFFPQYFRSICSFGS